MAAPYVTGASALVQQAFPYLSAKQLGDVLLSTANNQLNLTGYQVQMVGENNKLVGFNIMFDSAPPDKPLTQEALKQLAKAAYKDYYLTPAGWYAKDIWDEYVDVKKDRWVQAYYYAGQQELVGQGVLDVSKAVRGPGALNARRLTKADLSTDYTVSGSTTSQALYPVDTAGYNSCWSNDIKEVKAGLIAKDSSEKDLSDRWNYYYYNWISNAQASDGMRTVTSDYVKYFNNKVEASGLKGLSVGLYKSGDGILRLTGNNTYQGSTIAAGGTLAVDGSVAGDAWSVGGGNSGSDSSEAGGTLAGSGTVNGNVYNKGTLKPGSYAVNSVYDTNPAFSLGTLTVKGQLNSTGALEVAADGTQNSKLAVSGSSSLTGSTFKVDPLHAPLLNHTYNYLTSEGGIAGNVDPSLVSPYVTLTGSVIGNNAYLTASQTRTLGSLPGMTPSENSVGGALDRMTGQAVAARSDSSAAQALYALLYQDEKASRRCTKEVTSEGRAQLLSNSPLTRLTSETVYSRLDAADYSGLVGAEVKLPQLKESESGSEVMRTTTPVALDASNNLWFKLFKGYETYNYNDELKNHTFGGAVGYDHAVNLTTRVGGLFSYGVTNYSTDNISGDSHDWRVGAYIDHKNGNWDYQGLVSYGRNKYDLDRSINLAGSGLGNSTLNSDYQAKVWDMEAKARYLIPSTKTKIWQLTPYGKISYTHTNQDAYSETAGGSSMASSGSSVFAQNIDSASNNSTRGEIGLEFKRSYDKHGGWGGSVGYKRVLSGVNPELNGTFAGDTLSGNGFTIQSDNDKNFVTYSLNVHGSLGGKWTGQAELRGEASPHTHKEIISVAAKYHF